MALKSTLVHISDPNFFGAFDTKTVYENVLRLVCFVSMSVVYEISHYGGERNIVILLCVLLSDISTRVKRQKRNVSSQESIRIKHIRHQNIFVNTVIV